jgi:hypothetical protein
VLEPDFEVIPEAGVWYFVTHFFASDIKLDLACFACAFILRAKAI